MNPMPSLHCLQNTNSPFPLLWMLIAIVILLGCKEKTETVFVSNEKAHYQLPFEKTNKTGRVEESILVDYLFLKNEYEAGIGEVKQMEFELKHDTTINCAFGSTYWVQYRFENTSDQDLQYYLCLLTMDFNQVEAYLVDEKGETILIDSIGNLLDFSSRSIKTKELSFPLKIPANEKRTVYLHLDHRYMPTNTFIELNAANEQIGRSEAYKFSYGITTGIAFAYLAIAFILLLLAKDRFWESFYFLLYTIGYALYIFYQHGFGLYYLWGNRLHFLSDCAPFVAICFSYIGFFGIFRSFFHLKNKAPFANKYLQVVNLIILLMMLLLFNWQLLTQLYAPSYMFLTITLAFISTISLFFSLFMGGLIFKKYRHLEYLLFLLAFLPIIALGLLTWAMEFGLLPIIPWLKNQGPATVLLYEGSVLASFIIGRVYFDKEDYKKELLAQRADIVDDLHTSLLPTNFQINRILEDLGGFKQEKVNSIKAISNKMDEDIRLIQWVLQSRNPNLKTLINKIQDQVSERLKNIPIQKTIDVNSRTMPDIRIPFSINYHLLFFVLEAVNNIIKHAQADYCSIQLTYKEEKIRVRIQDNGVGFDPQKALQQGHGLKELSRRVQKMNAEDQFVIDSTISEGTSIQLSVSVSYVNQKDVILPK